MGQCTKKDCTGVAAHTLTDKQGAPWAYLCTGHYEEYNNIVAAAIKEPTKGNIKRMLGNWVKVQGGAEAAAKRLL